MDRKSKLRPALGGCSIGHYSITAGTLGCVVRKDGQRMILSNNHVLANVNKGKIGDAILQPGAYDGGTVDDKIAKLYKFVKIELSGVSYCPLAKIVVISLNFIAKCLGSQTRLLPIVAGGENTVDCALAYPNQDEDISDEIIEVGILGGETEPELGMRVKKSGRTTGLTEGIITQMGVVCSVNMGDAGIAIFSEQLAVESLSNNPFSQGGDSGSVILAEDNKGVGLLFAGGDNITLANTWQNVKEALGLD